MSCLRMNKENQRSSKSWRQESWRNELCWSQHSEETTKGSFPGDTETEQTKKKKKECIYKSCKDRRSAWRKYKARTQESEMWWRLSRHNSLKETEAAPEYLSTTTNRGVSEILNSRWLAFCLLWLNCSAGPLGNGTNIHY